MGSARYKTKLPVNRIEIIYINPMEPANNAIQIFREGIEFTGMLVPGVEPSTSCRQAFSHLSQCILTKRLNVLDKEKVRSECEVDEWRASCPGGVQRNHIENLYRKSVSQRLYTQEQLNKYMEAKNHNTHWGIVDFRY